MTKTSVKSPLVRKLEGFQALEPDERSFVDRIEATTRRMPAGSDLTVQGEPFGSVMILRKGWVMRFKTLSDGRRQIINFVIPGDIIGLYADLLPISDQSASALTDVEVAECPPDWITDMFHHHPRLAASFAWTAACDAAVLAEKVACLGRRRAHERLAHLILEMLHRLRSVQLADGDRFVFPATQEVIADTLGLSAVHVNRTLARMRAEGLIEIDGPVIHVLRASELTAAADFDDVYLYARRPAAAAGTAGDGMAP